MRQTVKRALLRLLTDYPVYRLVPPSGLRTYAALRYHGQRMTSTQLAQLVRSIGALPTRPLSAAMLAARAVFRSGQDDVIEEVIERLAARYPRSPEVLLLRSDLALFQGRYPDALRSAEAAAQLAPGSAGPAARIVKLGYRVWERDEADDAAVRALARFPLNHAVLWQVAVACTTPAQYGRVMDAWSAAVPDPSALARVARQLAVAATRSGLIDEAIDLYRRACTLLPDAGAADRTPTTTLAGLGASTAIEDICQALDDASVPFFFAAGTVLGLVRDGRPLTTDGDIDVGIMEEDWDRDALVSIFTRHPRFDLDLHPQSSKIGLRHRGGAPIDIFRFYRQGGSVWHDGVFVRWHNSPFAVTRRPLPGGLPVPMPSDTDRYLTENYGDWRRPDPTFDAFVDAPNLEITWPEHHTSHVWRRVYELTAGGDRAGAQRMLLRAERGASATNG